MQRNIIRNFLICLVIVSLNSLAYAKDKHSKETHRPKGSHCPSETNELRIINATANLENGILYINGEHFGDDPEIWLDDDVLSIQFNSDEYVEAVLPNDIAAGAYRLVVEEKKEKKKHPSAHMRKPNESSSTMDSIDITIGVVGPQGPEGEAGLQGPVGAKGAKGDKGDKGDTGAQGIAGPVGPQGAKGDTGLQGPVGAKGDKGDKGDTGAQGIAGPVGPQGARGETGLQGPVGTKGDKGDKGDPGISGYGIVSNSASYTLLSFGGNAGVLSVSCPSGKKVLGGGGKSDYNGDLLSESYPTATGNGWTIKYTNQSSQTKMITLTVYAICAECQ